MQQIAAENNLPETAFFVPEGRDYSIRWFTPTTEVELCGHATLAAAFVLFEYWIPQSHEVRFLSRSGILPVFREGTRITLDFPCDTLVEIRDPILLQQMEQALGVPPASIWKGRTDYLVILDKSEQIAQLMPDFSLLAAFPVRGVIVSAKGINLDFVSRFFAPNAGLPEDPVTGSAHTTLTPYWSGVLGKLELEAAQWSKRGGRLSCRLLNERVLISGTCRLYLKGEIYLPDRV